MASTRGPAVPQSWTCSPEAEFTPIRRGVERRLASAPQRIQRTIKLEHIDARLADDAEETTFDMLLYELPHAVLWQAAGASDARHLEQGTGRRDIGVEPARRCGHKIDRHWR